MHMRVSALLCFLNILPCMYRDNIEADNYVLWPMRVLDDPLDWLSMAC